MESNGPNWFLSEHVLSCHLSRTGKEKAALVGATRCQKRCNAPEQGPAVFPATREKAGRGEGVARHAMVLRASFRSSFVIRQCVHRLAFPGKRRPSSLEKCLAHSYVTGGAN